MTRPPFSGRRPAFSGFGGGGPTPTDIWVLLGVVFATFSLPHLSSAAGDLLFFLRLTPGIFKGLLWQLVTYPFVGFGAPSIFIVLELWILWMFAKDVYRTLGQRRFWQLLVAIPLMAALVAAAIEGFSRLIGGGSPEAFRLMQGQRMLMVVLIAAFATLRANATILLMFVIPIQARWFLWLEVLFAFIALLAMPIKDWAGFLGICAAVLGTRVWLDRRPGRALLREWRLRVEKWLIQRKMARMRSRRRFKVVKGGGDGKSGGNGSPPWIN